MSSPLSTRLRNLAIGAATASALALGTAAPAHSVPTAPAVAVAPAVAAQPAASTVVAAASSRSYSKSERRLTAKTKRVHRELRKKFPQIKTIGGYRPASSGEHGKGRALDVMLPNWKSSKGKALGKKIASWARSNAGKYKIWYVIYDQKIWNTQRAKEGWRKMRNAGSANGNHKNHVHISVKR